MGQPISHLRDSLPLSNRSLPSASSSSSSASSAATSSSSDPTISVSTAKLQAIVSVLQIASLSAGALVALLVIKQLREKDSEERATTAAKKEKWRLLTGRATLPTLTSHEETVLTDVIFPDQLAQSFADVGGLKSIKRTLYESVLVPLQQPELFRKINEKHALLGVPSGILFYGPPGTGKTLMAKSIAKSARCTFINVSASSLQNKWFGESQKLVRALFSLAEKLAPSIIFIDECDAFMRKRGSSMQNEASSAMASEFLTLADGLLTSNRSDPTRTVTLLACTNRPFDIDEAFLRRLPRTFFFDLPSRQERIAILKVLLQGRSLNEDVDFQRLAELTNKCSGSDLKEICKIAAARPLRKLIQKHSKADYERVMSGKERPKNNGPVKNDTEANELLAAIMAASAAASSAAPAPPVAASCAAPSAPSSAASSAASSPSPSSSPPPSAATSAPSSAAVSLVSPTTTTTISSGRPLRMSDFRSAIRAIRPAGLDETSMAKLKQWQSAHGHSSSVSRQTLEDDDDEEEEDRISGASDSEDDEEAKERRRSVPEAKEEEEDDDEIYR